MTSSKKPCVLYKRECIECGECDRCDLDPEKLCDNCMKCINSGKKYRAVLIDSIETADIMPNGTISMDRDENPRGNRL